MFQFRTFTWQFACVVALGSLQNLPAQTPAKPEGTEKESSLVIELIETGKSPHRQLRFTAKPGDKLSKVMTTKLNQEMTIAGQKAPQVNVPGQKIFIDVETKKVSPNGEIEFEFGYVDVEVDDDPNNPSPIAAQIESMVKPLIGTKGSATITSRGLTTKSEFKTPENLNPMIKGMLDGMKDSLNQLSSPLPEEAVGVGGKWKTVQVINSNGIKLKQTSISEVTKLDSSGFALKVSIEQTADPQDVKNAMLPAGATMKLESLRSSGDGESQFAFTDFFPKSTTVKVNSKTAMAFSIAGQSQKMATDMKMEMTLEDAPKK